MKNSTVKISNFEKCKLKIIYDRKNSINLWKRQSQRACKKQNGSFFNRQALGVIRLTLSCNVAFNIAKEITTAGLMKALSNMFEKPSASNKVHLMRQLFSLRMSEGGSVAQHLNELNYVTTQLSFVEIKFDDEVLALILLSSLPDS